MQEIRFSNLTNPRGDFEILKDVQAIIDSYTKLLSIRRGTYPSDPEIGTQITKYLFDLNNETTIELIKDEVEDTLSQEDRATISKIDVFPVPDQNAIYIRVICLINGHNVEINLKTAEKNTTFVKYKLLENV